MKNYNKLLEDENLDLNPESFFSDVELWVTSYFPDCVLR